MHVQPQDALPKIMLARYCAPSLGRFLSVDPIPGRPNDPQSWQAYGYVGNNPINLIDPDGQLKVDPRDQVDWNAAVNYLNKSEDGRELLAQVNSLSVNGTADEPILVTNSSLQTNTQLPPGQPAVVNWDPNGGLDVAGLGGKPDSQGGTVQTPALGLAGELFHIVRSVNKPNAQEREHRIDSGLGGSAESLRKVGVETKIAKQLDEPTRVLYTALDDQGNRIQQTVRVQCATCKK